jgi:hypothetical protein
MADFGSSKVFGDLNITGTETVSKLRIVGTDGVGLTSTSHPLQIGVTTGTNLAFSGSDIKARNNGVAAPLHLNYDGGAVYANGQVIWHAGNDGSGSGLDADLLEGYHADTAASANTIVRRNGNGYIYTVHTNCSRPDETSAAASYVYDSGDGWLRKKTLANAKAELVTSAAVTGGLGYTPVNKAGDSMSGNLTFSGNYGLGMVGLYSDTRYQNVFSMGASYTPSADGTSLAGMYGIAWTHTNVGGQSKAGLSHQALFVDGGVTKTAIGTGIWTAGSITTQGSVIIGTGTTSTLTNQADGSLNHSNANGYIQIGPKNTSYAHIYTDRPTFYFNKDLLVNGNKVWHAGNMGHLSTLDADTLDTMQPSTAADANTIVARDGNGFVSANKFTAGLNRWMTDGTGGLDMNNSDIIGLNGIWFKDEASPNEGISWPKTGKGGSTNSADYDQLWAIDGALMLNNAPILIKGNPGYYSTSNTGSTSIGQWTKVATYDIGGQFEYITNRLYFQEGGSALEVAKSAEIIVRIKQQPAMLADPHKDIHLVRSTNYPIVNFKLITTSLTASNSKIELWMLIPDGYSNYQYTPLSGASEGSSKITYHEAQGFSVSPPTQVANGTSTTFNTGNVNHYQTGSLRIHADQYYNTALCPGSTSQIGLFASNNSLGIGIDHTYNSRVGWIQVGHATDTYASSVGELRLNPIGGTVTINGQNGVGDVALFGGSDPGIEMRSKNGGTPYIDFSNDTSVDYDARIILNSNDELAIEGAVLKCNGGLKIGSNRIFVGSSTPSGAVTGDIWIDTSVG